MTSGNAKAQLRGQALQLHLPQPHPVAVAAPAIGADQQLLRPGIRRPAHAQPPAPDTGDGKTGGVVITAHIHPAFVLTDIIHPHRE